LKVAAVEEMRRLDREAEELFGIPESLLMENAALAVVRAMERPGPLAGKRVVVLCGTGNNGGDGFAVARKLLSHGAVPAVFLAGDPERLSGAAEMNYRILLRLPVRVERLDSIGEFAAEIGRSHLIVDALFGTGLAREVSGIHREAILEINRSGRTVYSVDIPSGVSGDTGEILGLSVKADHTVTFGLPKRGNLLYPGAGQGGKLHVSHISFPPSLSGDERISMEINLPVSLPPRKPDGHKGDFGEALFVAGASGYYGAPFLSAMAFLRAGGGYARLAAPRSVVPVLAAKGGEIVFLPQEETPRGSLAGKSRESILGTARNMDFVVLGPGLSLDGETADLVRDLAREVETPLLIDGDGITAVAKDPGILSERRGPTVLTPHMGEMARLTGRPVGELERDRVEILRETSGRLRAFMVLKGAHSLVADPRGRVWINLTGNPGMATAGSGDVLTGAVAAMAGLGLPLPDAVRMGVFVHGLAGDLAGRFLGEDGLTAGDLLDYLPPAMKVVREKGAAPGGEWEFFPEVL
jgi:NAD(P)H-hydrate epimerase